MAAITDLINQVEDKTLRERCRSCAFDETEEVRANVLRYMAFLSKEAAPLPKSPEL